MATPLFTRWFQRQVFTPGFRLHLDDDSSAPWCSPDPAQRLLVDLIRLRRRLTPYSDSTGVDQEFSPEAPRARAASRRSADFTRDAVALGPLSFGPSLRFIPAPPAATASLPVALPPEHGWTDFWTGAAYAGGQTVRVAAPLEQVPIFVRAGTVLPLATLDNVTGRASYPLEIRIYPGADGSFMLRERINDKPDARAHLVFDWNDQTRTLRVGQGASERPALARRFKIFVVHPGRGIGAECPQRPDIEVEWNGDPLQLCLPQPEARPHPPDRLAAVFHGDSVHFSWQESRPGTFYRLKRATHPGGRAEDVASSLGAPRCAVPLAALDAPALFVVTASNSGGESAPSAAIRVEPPIPTAARQT